MTEDVNETCENDQKPADKLRPGFLVLAYVATAFGIAGVFLPLLPATPFLLVAVWAASRGSPRVHDWIYRQPQFARILHGWHEQGAVPFSAKCVASAMMAFSWLFLLLTGYGWIVLLGLSLFFACVGTFLWTRPNPTSENEEH
jgi:uncharacterized membrane protein YbaN (DUF454 family)